MVNRSRTGGRCGPFLEEVESVEPLLRRVADAEICTARPLDEVVTAVLRVAND